MYHVPRVPKGHGAEPPLGVVEILVLAVGEYVACRVVVIESALNLVARIEAEVRSQARGAGGGQHCLRGAVAEGIECPAQGVSFVSANGRGIRSGHKAVQSVVGKCPILYNDACAGCVRVVKPVAPQQKTDGAGIVSRIGLVEDGAPILGSEAPPARPSDHFGTGNRRPWARRCGARWVGTEGARLSIRMFTGAKYAESGRCSAICCMIGVVHRTGRSLTHSGGCG